MPELGTSGSVGASGGQLPAATWPLNRHFHMLFLDGVYVEDVQVKLRFHRVKAPNVDELKALVHAISHRVVGLLERRGCWNAMRRTVTWRSKRVMTTTV